MIMSAASMRVPPSSTNVNIASVASELPVREDSVSVVHECSSPFYLTGGSLAVPLMLWGEHPPIHSVTVVRIMPDNRTIITGSAHGHVLIWRCNEDFSKINPTHLIIAHSSTITAISAAGVAPSTSRFVTADKNGRICLFESMDGRCIESIDERYVHTEIIAHEIRSTEPSSSEQARLFCIGHYSEILVLDPHDLYIMLTLVSRVEQNWLSAICLVRTSQSDHCIGLSQSGLVKIWKVPADVTLKEAVTDPIYEDESKQIRCDDVVCLVTNPSNPRMMLVVGGKQASLHDAADFAEVLSIVPAAHASWSGAYFYAIDKIALYSDDGTTSLFQLPRCALANKSCGSVISGREACCFAVLKSSQAFSSSYCYTHFCPPSSPTQTSLLIIIRATGSGAIDAWKIPDVPDKAIAQLQQQNFGAFPEINSCASNSLHTTWSELSYSPPAIAGHLSDWRNVRTTLYVASTGRLFLGRNDGSILVISAVQSILRQLLDTSVPGFLEKCVHCILRAHYGPVTALLYPREYSERYESNHFLSGSSDFSVVLWDLHSGTPLHTFSVQAGGVTSLCAPPEQCSPRIGACVCSVAADNSVALLSLKELKCVLLASRHLLPVDRIIWRPFDDSMLVLTSDHTVYVWQMESGALDRVVGGLLADEVLAASRELTRQWLETNVAQTSTDGKMVNGDAYQAPHTSAGVQMFRAIRHKNMAAVRQIAVDAVFRGDTDNNNQEFIIDQEMPLQIKGVHARPADPQSHLLVFNIEALIYGLLVYEWTQNSASATTSQSDIASQATSLLDAHHTQSIGNLLNKAKEKAAGALQLSPSLQRKNNARDRSPSTRLFDASAVQTNNLCLEVAHLLMSCLHAWDADDSLDKLCAKKLGLLKPKMPLSFGIVSRHGHVAVMMPFATHPQTSGIAGLPLPSKDLFRTFAKTAHWSTSSTITTQHVQTVVALAETMKSLTHPSFTGDSDSKRRVLMRMSSIQNNNLIIKHTQQEKAAIDQLKAESEQLRQAWEFVGTLHFSMLHETITDFKSPRIELLARRWQDRCIELRIAARALLLKELKRIDQAGRAELVKAWAPYLPSVVGEPFSLFTTNELAMAVGTTVTSVSVQLSADEMAKHGPVASALTPLASVTMMRGTDSNVHELRRRQATAIVLLAVIGAEHTDEIIQTSAKGRDQLKRYIAESLSALLLANATPLLPLHSPLRRAGIDLLGRGFAIWEPYVDIKRILIALLELCAGGERILAGLYSQSTPPHPLSAIQDACRTAHEALSCIACARTDATITALSTEVARHNAATHAQTLQHVAGQSTLARSRHEVVKLIELLCEQRPDDVAAMMVPVSDILAHILDTALLKARTIQEVMPCLAKFKMIDYNASSKRLVAGGNRGNIVIHELRGGKSQTVMVHNNNPITSLALNDDGKYLASYSAVEARLNIFQTGSSFLGMGQSQIKHLKQLNAPDKGTKLVWTSTKSVTLMQSNGQETRFAI